MQELIHEKDFEDPKITVRPHTFDEEIQYVWNKIKRIDFYNRLRYNLSLPETDTIKSIINMAIEKELTDKDIEVLRKELAKVYKNEFYGKGINSIRASFGIVNELSSDVNLI